MRRTLALALAFVLLAACRSGAGPRVPRYDAQIPGDVCGGIRLTQYTASTEGWCQWDRTRSFLPAFVTSGMTAAIAEPWNGGSYGGDPGEACGECWEVDSLTGTEIVMIHDLCPIAGNPLCAGSYFHFDLSDEAGGVLMQNGVNQASARRIPCPVSGNVHVQVNDLSPGYMRVAFLNHRIPIRSAEIRGAGAGVAATNPWRALQREDGAFVLDGGATPLANGGDAIAVRLTSAQGEALELPTSIPTSTTLGAAVDLGAQLTDLVGASGSSCRFVAPGDVYVDAWGGIDEVPWRFDGWAANVVASETTSGCVVGRCLRVDGIAQWSGFHLYYVEPFPRDDFARLALSVRTTGGTGSITIAPSLAGAPCTETTVSVGPSFAEVSIDLATVCPSTASLDGITVQASSALGLVIDDVRFVP